VIASGGYPGSYEKGKVIRGLEAFDGADGYYCFHAGTAFAEDGSVVTSGGRVLGVTALGPTLTKARENAYKAAKWVTFDGAFMRSDIGKAIDAVKE
jgi:phosphoribosylamine--glycine ligase